VATDIEMDEATYEDDSLHAENEMPDEMPDSTANTDGRGSRKRTQTASETWAHAKKPKLGEVVRRDCFGNKIWACSKCSWESGSLTSARNHLNHKHGIKIQAQQPKVVTKGQAKLQQILRQHGEKQQVVTEGRERKALQDAINRKTFEESLLQFIINNNLPHKLVEYPELYSMILSVNYMAGDILPKSRVTIPKKIELSLSSYRQ